MPVKISALLFDAVGTLIRPQPSVGAAYAQAAERHGLKVDEAQVASRFRQAFATQETLDRQLADRTSPQREYDRWRAIVAEVFFGAPQADAIFRDLWDHFADPAHWRLFPDAAPAWSRFSGTRITLGLASNFDSRLAGICAQVEPLSTCKNLFVSSELGWRKPSPAFFTEIERQLGLAPEQIMLVGDDWTNDYQAARSAGWQAVWLVRDAVAGEVTAPPNSGAERINSLDELDALLQFRLTG